MTKLLTSANPSLKGLPPWERKQHLRRLQVATPNASQSSLFLDLPPELRNRIYELVLASQHRIDIDARPYITGRTTRSKTKARRSSAVVGEPLLLRTCQIVPNEATQMYYDLNVVKCRQRRLVYPWLEGVGATKRGMLADIRLFRRYSARHNDPYFNLNLLLDFQHFENELAEARTELKTGALRVYRKRARVTDDDDGSGTAWTKSEIEAAMTEHQWEAYRARMRHLERNAMLRTDALRRQRSAAPEVEAR